MKKQLKTGTKVIILTSVIIIFLTLIIIYTNVSATKIALITQGTEEMLIAKQNVAVEIKDLKEPHISFVDNQIKADIEIEYPYLATNIEYSTDNGTTWITYAGTFQITEIKTIIARCIYEGEIKTSSLLVATGKKHIEDFASDPNLQYGQGALDISDILATALKSNYKYIEFGKTGTEYKISKHLTITATNKYLIGNNSIIFTDDSFAQTYSEFVIRLSGNNVVFDTINFEARESKISTFRAYKTQLGISGGYYITITNCKFIIPDTVSSNRPWVNLDLHSNWGNVIVEDSLFENYSDSDAGGNIAVRQISNSGIVCSDLLIRNNECHKRTHDEMVWIVSYVGAMKDIKVTNNKFIMYDTFIEHNNVHCVTIGAEEPMYDVENYPNAQLDNVEFSNNTLVGVGTASVLYFTGGTNISINDNDITYYKIRGSTSVYAINLPSSVPDAARNNYSIENNNITINNGAGAESIAGLMNVDIPFVNNTVTINTNVTAAIFGRRTSTVIGNDITVNANTRSIARAPKTFINNTVHINGSLLSHVFEINNAGSVENLTQEVLVKGNKISSEIAQENRVSFALINNNILFNNHTMTFQDNNIYTPRTIAGQLNYKCYINIANLGDTKKIYFINNVLDAYTSGINQSQVTDTVNVITIPYKIETVNEIEYIQGIQIQTTSQELKQTIEIPANYKVEITNKDENILTDTQYVGTGSTIIIKDENNNIIKEYKVAVKGDITGDGLVNFADIIRLTQYVYEPEANFEWTEILRQAGKVSGINGNPGFADIIAIIRYVYEGVMWQQ